MCAFLNHSSWLQICNGKNSNKRRFKETDVPFWRESWHGRLRTVCGIVYSAWMIAHATILLLPQTRHVRMHIKNPLLEKEIRGKSQRPGSKKGPTQIFNEGCVLFWLTCPSYIPKSVAMSREKHHSSNCKQWPLECNSTVYRFHY